MEKTILTPKQHDFLECVRKEPGITKTFYLTGGTALSEFYLHHRLSEDIDLFTVNEEVDQRLVHVFLKKIKPKLSIQTIKESNFLGLYSYTLIYDDKEKLKVDFNYYPFSRIERGTHYKELSVDSIYDIAVNKVHTLFMKPRTRDYIDLFFIMKDHQYPLETLIINAKTKFDWHIDPVNLASQFVRVKELKQEEFPAMLVPFDRKEMERFFLGLAKSLETEIFK